MGKLNRLYAIIGVLAVLMLAAAAITYTARVTNAGGNSDDDAADCAGNANDDGGTDATDPNQADGETNDDCGAAGAPGVLDDGGALLPKAGISIEQAIAAAQASAGGNVGEVDLEYHKGTLVFNVDIGGDDVKVDANTGEVIGSGKD